MQVGCYYVVISVALWYALQVCRKREAETIVGTRCYLTISEHAVTWDTKVHLYEAAGRW